MKHIKGLELNESTPSEDMAHSILGNRELQRKINDVLGDTHAFLLGSHKKVNNMEFSNAMKETIGKIIDTWEF
jgi:hypothetical protein